jgi:hypothetical protein
LCTSAVTKKRYILVNTSDLFLASQHCDSTI